MWCVRGTSDTKEICIYTWILFPTYAIRHMILFQKFENVWNLKFSSILCKDAQLREPFTFWSVYLSAPHFLKGFIGWVCLSEYAGVCMLLSVWRPEESIRSFQTGVAGLLCRMQACSVGAGPWTHDCTASIHNCGTISQPSNAFSCMYICCCCC